MTLSLFKKIYYAYASSILVTNLDDFDKCHNLYKIDIISI